MGKPAKVQARVSQGRKLAGTKNRRQTHGEQSNPPQLPAKVAATGQSGDTRPLPSTEKVQA